MVVIGGSNWGLDPKGTHRAQKRVPKRASNGTYTLSSAVEQMQALCDKNLFALRCEFYVVITDNN